MKAIQVHRFGGPEVLELKDVPAPEVAAGTVLVRVRAAGVNPVDTYIRSGTYTFQPALPYTPGMDAAGEVEAVGHGAAAVSVGDRVYTAGTLTGAYADKTLCAISQVFPLPDSLSFAQGAALGIPYATAYQALFGKARAAKGDLLLIHGASGGVGLAAIQLARAAGLTIVGTAGTDAGRALVGEQGAEHVLDHHDPDHLERALELTNDEGFDVILEMLANANLGHDLTLLAKRGRVIVIGSRGEVTVNPRDLMSRDGAILGMTLMNLTEAERREIHEALAGGMRTGVVNPIVSTELSLDEAARAHRDVIESNPNGKIVLVP